MNTKKGCYIFVFAIIAFSVCLFSEEIKAAEIQTRYCTIYTSSPSTKVDVGNLFERVCNLMPVKPKFSHPLRIEILENRQAVRIKLMEISGVWKDVFGFYVDILCVIYISADELAEGTLAHEMTHFVSCRGYRNELSREQHEEWAHYIELAIKN